MPKNEKVRISPRISRATYMLAKEVYKSMGVTFENRVELLIKRDVKREINKPWFKNGMNALGKELNLPEGMNWEKFWMKCLLSEEAIKFDESDPS